MRTSPEERSPVIEVLRRYRAHVQAELDLVDQLVEAIRSEQEAIASRLARCEFPERMSMARAARYLGIGKQRLYKLIDDGDIPGLAGHRANQRVVVRRADLDAYVLGLPARRRGAMRPGPSPEESNSGADE